MAAVGTDTVSFRMQAFDPELVGSIFTRVDMCWPRDASAQFGVTTLGDLSLIHSMHSACRSTSRRLERHMVRGEEGYFFACVPIDGDMTIRHLGWAGHPSQECMVTAGHLALLNTHKEYEIAMSDRLDAIWLRIPERLMRAHAISPDDLVGRSLDIRQGLGLVAQQMMCGAMAESQSFTARAGRVMSQSLLTFLGEVANANLESERRSNSRGRRMILKRAHEFIEDHIDDEAISPAMIARGLGISLRYLSEIFAAENTSPMRWVLRRRLELCRMELERNSGSQTMISEVAYSMGFTNISSFNRAFKAQFGQSPRELIAQSAARSPHRD